MRVLITGHNGNVGSEIARLLSAQGWEVIGLDRSLVNEDNVLGKEIGVDISSVSLVDNIAEKIEPCEVIVHTAAMIDYDNHHLSTIMTNCLGTQNILRLAALWKTQTMVYTSSIQVIGTPRTIPITEEHPVEPNTVYHASKLFGEHLCNIAQINGLRTVVLRLTSPVGPRMDRGRIFPVFIKQALAGEPLSIIGKGNRQQNYVDVRDIATAVERFIISDVHGVYNIAGKQAISNLELAQACISLFGSRSNIKYSDVPDREEGLNWDISINKAADMIGYEPIYSLEDSIRYIGKNLCV
ncbi:MAG: NAD(P)-dependent oxidoreductase [Syntrophomonadaceae bacterium]|nr:NAD(P)-dependent oxidoreductase [Syntrophomonadaceae bacterium]